MNDRVTTAEGDPPQTPFDDYYKAISGDLQIGTPAEVAHWRRFYAELIAAKNSRQDFYSQAKSGALG